MEQFLTTWLPMILAAWPLLALLAALTPTPVDNKVLEVLRKVLDALAFNFAKAKNYEAAKAEDIKERARAEQQRRKNRDKYR